MAEQIKSETQEAQNEVAQKEASSDKPNEGNNPRPLDKVERAEQAIKRMEELESSISKKVDELQHLRSEQILGGGSEAGSVEQKPKEETPQEYAKKLTSGRV